MTWTTLAVFVAVLAGQSFWIARVLAGFRSEMGGIRSEMHENFAAVRADIRQIRADVQGIKDDGLRSLGERVARLEAQRG